MLWQAVAMLLEAPGGCEMDALDHTERTALFQACEAGHLEVARLLIDHGAKHDRDAEGTSAGYENRPLVVASKAGNLALVSDHSSEVQPHNTTWEVGW